MNAPTLDRWIRVWRRVTATDDPESVFEELISLYSEPHRYYHNLQHIADCLAEFDSARPMAKDPIALELAIWFHDAIYDTHAADNEERSAELARKRLGRAGGSVSLCESAAALVLATKAHNPALHPDAPLLIDVDLSILGQPSERFQEYETEIRREYEWVPAGTFAAKRTEILEGFLARQKIYTTEQFFLKYERQARANLRGSIRALRTGIMP